MCVFYVIILSLVSGEYAGTNISICSVIPPSNSGSTNSVSFGAGYLFIQLMEGRRNLFESSHYFADTNVSKNVTNIK